MRPTYTGNEPGTACATAPRQAGRLNKSLPCARPCVRACVCACECAAELVRMCQWRTARARTCCCAVLTLALRALRPTPPTRHLCLVGEITGILGSSFKTPPGAASSEIPSAGRATWGGRARAAGHGHAWRTRTHTHTHTERGRNVPQTCPRRALHFPPTLDTVPAVGPDRRAFGARPPGPWPGPTVPCRPAAHIHTERLGAEGVPRHMHDARGPRDAKHNNAQDVVHCRQA